MVERGPVAVVMPVRNCAPYIGQALASLTAQSADALLDVIVVDDGSTDNTSSVVRSVMEQFSLVRLFEVEGRGISAARNTGLRKMRPDTAYVTFLDADDVSPQGRIRQGLEHFEADPKLDLVFGSMRVFSELDAEKLEPKVGTWSVDIRGVQLGAGLFRAGLVREVGEFDADFATGEDVDFLLRVFEAEPHYLLTSEICVFYRRHAANTSNDRPAVAKGHLRALMKSVRRRKGRDDFRYPAGLFDGTNLAKMRGI